MYDINLVKKKKKENINCLLINHNYLIKYCIINIKKQ